jgi:hypothetical protein
MSEPAGDTGPIDYLVVEFPEGTMTPGRACPPCWTSSTAT